MPIWFFSNKGSCPQAQAGYAFGRDTCRDYVCYIDYNSFGAELN